VRGTRRAGLKRGLQAAGRRQQFCAASFRRQQFCAASSEAQLRYVTHSKLGLPERRGGGEGVSIDGLRFVVPPRTIHAVYNRRYIDRRRGVTLIRPGDQSR
jgi:hypothetical protein